MKTLIRIPTLLLLTACASTRVPIHGHSSDYGVVHAGQARTAAEYARILDDVGPYVARAIPGLVVEPVDLRVVRDVSDAADGSPHPEFAGATFDHDSVKWIEIRSDLDHEARRGVLAHELVHRWLGPSWSTLPPAFEDGLADVVGDAIREDDTPQSRMQSFVACWVTLNGSLTVDRHGSPVDAERTPFSVTLKGRLERLTPAEVLDAMGRDLPGYRSIQDPRHFAVIAVLSRRVLSRISVDELFAMCRAAADEGLERVPPERILRAARIDPRKTEDWNALLLETYGLAEREALKGAVDVPWGLGGISAVEGLAVRMQLQATVDF